MFSMKTVLLLALFLYAASAAPAEDKPEAPEAVAVVDPPEEQMAAVPVPIKEEEKAAPELRFNPCPNGWNLYGARCFAVVRASMSWKNAKEYCSGLGAHLASVTSSGEYSYLQQITAATGQSQAWLGGFNLEGEWMWTDNAGFYYSYWTYVSSPYSSNPCIYLNKNYGWGNTACYSTKYFICSKRPSSC